MPMMSLATVPYPDSTCLTMASRSTASRSASRTLGSANGPSATRMTIGIAMSLGRRTIWTSWRFSAVRAATAPTLEATSIWPASRALAIAWGLSKILTSMASRRTSPPYQFLLRTNRAFPARNQSSSNGPVPGALPRSESLVSFLRTNVVRRVS